MLRNEIVTGTLLALLLLSSGRLWCQDAPPNGPGGEPTTEGAAKPCPAPCTNTGIQWVPPREEEVGSQACPLARVGIQWGGYGLSFSFGTMKCPRWYVYTPGHWGRVSKNCFDAKERDGAQSLVFPQRQAVVCNYTSTPGVSTVSCRPTGQPTQDPPLANYDETPCGNSIGGQGTPVH